MVLIDDKDLFYEPQESLAKELESGIIPCEMSDFQLAFLCGLLKKYNPKLIWEVGMSAGGTTAVILRTLELLNLHSEVHSVDLLEYWYKDKTKSAGWFVEGYNERNSRKSPKATLHKGGLVSKFISSEEKNIDFLLLDAAHKTPGELIDFLLIFPHLSKGAIVVVHDIALQHKYCNEKVMTANSLLFATVVADKMITFDSNGYAGNYPNIGAFIINGDTEKYIENVFLALAIKWEYIPKQEQIEALRTVLRDKYSTKMQKYFESLLQLNIRSSEMKIKNENQKSHKRLNLWKR